MRKIETASAIALVLLGSLSLAACTNDAANVESKQTPNTSTQTEQPTDTATPTPTPEGSEAAPTEGAGGSNGDNDVNNGSGQDIKAQGIDEYEEGVQSQTEQLKTVDGAPTGEVVLLGPDAHVPLAEAQEELPLIIELKGADGALLTDAEVTFQVVDGPAHYEGGFDVSTSDATGVATSLDLVVTGPGTIRMQVATADLLGEFSVVVE